MSNEYLYKIYTYTNAVSKSRHFVLVSKRENMIVSRNNFKRKDPSSICLLNISIKLLIFKKTDIDVK